MDPTLTREKAHKLFGELYRKDRSPDLQKKVDDIVAQNSDIFVRIQKIEALDKKEAESKSKFSDASPSSRNKRGKERTSGIQQPAKKKDNVLKKIFGGDVARWGTETETLESGWFGANLKPSKSSYKVFSSFKENQIVAIIKAFRLGISYGWEVWDAEQYNTVMAAYQFFNEYVKTPSILKTVQKANDFPVSTMKLQRLYASLISYKNYDKILSENFLEFVEKNQSSDLASDCEYFIKFLKKIDAKSPTMQNIFRSYYALAGGGIRSFEEITNDLQTPPAILDTYRAPESVLEKINARIKKTMDDIRNKRHEVAEIEEIRQKYFKFEGTRVQTNFLNPICEQIVQRVFPKNLINEHFIKNQKSQPHRLLYLILKDLDLVVGPFLSNPVSGKSQGGVETVVIFRSGLFKPSYDEIDALIRELEIFSKNNATFMYSFKDFHSDAGNSGDSALNQLNGLIKRANKVFTRMVIDIRTVLENHRNADEHEKKQSSQEKQNRSKNIPIESLEVGSRFIPFSAYTLVSNDRLNDKSMIGVLNEISMNLYNYLYIYKDETTVRTLASAARLKSEIALLEKDLERMGGSAV
ncbi:MAG: hypothetical protein OEZ34_07655 [Spirochaetia bacterium]|nr:hypothetical protein [Spirochaetia bacterium]